MNGISWIQDRMLFADGENFVRVVSNDRDDAPVSELASFAVPPKTSAIMRHASTVWVGCFLKKVLIRIGY